jgi:hypothetical protein
VPEDRDEPGMPRVRGRAMAELVKHLDEYEPGLEAKVRARTPTESMQAIDRALPTDWILASHTRSLIEAIMAELGSDSPRLWSSLVGRRLFRSPMLRGFIDTIVRLGGLSPVRFLKSLPRGWPAAYKDWCEPQVVTTADRKATVYFRDVAPYLLEHRQHWVAIEGVLMGLVAAAHEQATVTMSYRTDESLVIADVRW